MNRTERIEFPVRRVILSLAASTSLFIGSVACSQDAKIKPEDKQNNCQKTGAGSSLKEDGGLTPATIVICGEIEEHCSKPNTIKEVQDCLAE